MSPYRQTIRRHRSALRIPIFICVLLAVWTALGSPKQYRSGVSLWVDKPPPSASWLESQDVSQMPPADSQQLVVQEMLQTRSFRLEVGQRSPLASYLAAGPPKGWAPMRILDAVSTPAAVDDQIVAALDPKKLTTTVAGPQVLQLTYTSTSPKVAAGTLRALVDVLNEKLASFGRDRGKASFGFYQDQVDSASKAVADARKAVADYERAHPGATSDDPQLKALLRSAKAAGPSLARATTRLNETSSALHAPGAVGAHLTVIDAPAESHSPTSGKKQLVMAAFAGLFVGGLISFLALIILTPSSTTEPARQERSSDGDNRERKPIGTTMGEPI